MNKLKFLYQKGMSIAEVLVAMVIATTVMGASYMIYSNFQGTFIRQIGHNNIKQEARFTLHVLQHDSRMAGYKHPDSTDGEVQIPVTVLNDDGTLGHVEFMAEFANNAIKSPFQDGHYIYIVLPGGWDHVTIDGVETKVQCNDCSPILYVADNENPSKLFKKYQP